MIELHNPFIDTVQHTKLRLLPRQLNADLYTHLKNNLVDKIQGKCNHNGYVEKVYKITDYKNGVINAEDPSASVIFDVEYECRLWLPKNKKYIIGKITLSNQTITRAENGPITIYIMGNQINQTNFTVDPGSIIYKKTNKKLNVDDLVIVEIKQIRLNYSESQINTIGYLFDIPNKDQVSKYFVEQVNEKTNELVL